MAEDSPQVVNPKSLNVSTNSSNLLQWEIFLQVLPLTGVFLLSNTLADYRNSENLPMQIVNSLIHINHFSEDLTVSSLIFTSLFYLLLLIRDLDNPFQYDGKSYVEVDLSILENYRDRLCQ
jgi:hypothetical protein